MNRVLCFVIAVALFSCDKNDPDPGIDITLNGDMETGATYPIGWGFAPGLVAGHSSYWSTDPVSSGSRSIGISASGPINSFCHWNQYYGNADKNFSGKSLTFSIKVRGIDLKGQGVSIAMRADAPSGNEFVSTEGRQLILGSFDWTTYEVSIPVVPDDATGVYIFLIFLPNSTGSVYFDDASLRYK